jgi:hypothetical protein
VDHDLAGSDDCVGSRLRSMLAMEMGASLLMVVVLSLLIRSGLGG